MDLIYDSSSFDSDDEKCLFLKSSFDHNAIINYLSAQRLLRSPNHQFHTKNGYFVCLFGPTSYMGNDSFKAEVQITRDDHESIKMFMAEQNLHPYLNHQSSSEHGEPVPNIPPQNSSTQS